MRDLGIDLGTANVLVYMKGRGIVLNEPSVIAINHLNKEIVAVGKAAHNMVGRTPGNITAIRPIKDGVIADYDTTATMLKYFIHGSRLKSALSIKKPRVIVCAPSGITGVEKRAIFEATIQAGAKQAYIIEEPFAAAIGAGLPVAEPLGSMVVDIGGGTTDIAIISLGGIVTSKSIRVGGDIMDNSIIQYVKRQYNMLIGERTAEAIKIQLGCAIVPEKDFYYEVRGRDLFTGLPKPIKLYSSEIQAALSEPVGQIVDAVKYTLEKCPPELSGDIMERGIVLTGGGALLRHLDRLIMKETHIPVIVSDKAMDCVAIGTGKALENIAILERLDKEKPLR